LTDDILTDFDQNFQILTEFRQNIGQKIVIPTQLGQNFGLNKKIRLNSVKISTTVVKFFSHKMPSKIKLISEIQ